MEKTEKNCTESNHDSSSDDKGHIKMFFAWWKLKGHSDHLCSFLEMLGLNGGGLWVSWWVIYGMDFVYEHHGVGAI